MTPPQPDARTSAGPRPLAVSAAAARATARPNVRINVASVDTRAFTAVTVGTTPAFRQLTAAQGGTPAAAQFVVILGAAAGPRTVVTVGGDPARAEALLRAARLQQTAMVALTTAGRDDDGRPEFMKVTLR